jgi:O-antigen ligase
MTIGRDAGRRLPFLRAAIPALLLTYAVMIGGTSIGELDPAARVVNMVCALGLVAGWALVLRDGSDRLDLAVTAALLLFLIACLASKLPRQSFVAPLGVGGYAAAFGVGRRVLADAAARRLTLTAMAVLSLLLSLMTAARWLPEVAAWMAVAPGQIPPLDLSFSAAPWGHRHDLTLLLVMLLPAWLMIPRNGAVAACAAIATVLTGVVVIVDGSRTLWIAIAISSVVVLAHQVSPRLLALSKQRFWVVVAGVAILLVASLAAGVSDRVLNLRTLAARGELWTSAIDAWWSRPLTGEGPRSFPWLLQTTGYFDTNSWAPRHPDSALIQLLAAVGIVGALAVAILVLSIGARIWQSRQASWALVAFLITGVGANPTDFGFLVAAAIAWSALATPYGRLDQAERQMQARPRGPMPTWALVLALVPIAAGMAFALAAETSYQSAGRAIARGDLPTAEDQLRTATAIDSRMALYHRALGLVRWARYGPTGGLDELRTAVAINPSDDYAFRMLAVAEWSVGDRDAANAAIHSAVRLQRSDTNNMLLAAQFAAADARDDDALNLVAETVQANPTLALAPGWKTYLESTGLSGKDVIDLAARRWEQGLPSPQPVTVQGLWLTAMAGRSDLTERAERQAPLAPGLAHSAALALGCEDDAAAAALAAAPAPRDVYYWIVRIRLVAERGKEDEDALSVLKIMTGNDRPAASEVDALDENTAPGFGIDQWGYRRLPIDIGGLAWKVPSPGAGLTVWLNGRSPDSCRRPQ